jgi:serine/threonine protein phosphatase PrpC
VARRPAGGSVVSPLHAHGASHTGLVRSHNEDHFFIGTVRKTLTVRDTNLAVAEAVEEMSRLEGELLVVADGVGGRSGGERASQSAVFALSTYIGRTAACQFDPDVEQEEEFLQRLERALERAHEVVRSLAWGARGGPATTLTLAMVVGVRAYIAHVGDSRAYHCRGARLRQITRDQTMAEMLSDAGADLPSGKSSALSNVLASAVGSQSMSPAIGLIDLAPGDWLLLCTDGLTKHVADDEIAAVLTRRGDDVRSATTDLIDAALAGGGSDNITAIVARLV